MERAFGDGVRRTSLSELPVGGWRIASAVIHMAALGMTLTFCKYFLNLRWVIENIVIFIVSS